MSAFGRSAFYIIWGNHEKNACGPDAELTALVHHSSVSSRMQAPKLSQSNSIMQERRDGLQTTHRTTMVDVLGSFCYPFTPSKLAVSQ